MRSDALPEQLLQMLGGAGGGQQVLQVMTTEDGQQVLQLIPQPQQAVKTMSSQPSGSAQRPQTPQAQVSPAPQQQIVQIVDSAGKIVYMQFLN